MLNGTELWCWELRLTFIGFIVQAKTICEIMNYADYSVSLLGITFRIHSGWALNVENDFGLIYTLNRSWTKLNFTIKYKLIFKGKLIVTLWNFNFNANFVKILFSKYPLNHLSPTNILIFFSNYSLQGTMKYLLHDIITLHFLLSNCGGKYPITKLL